MEVTRQLRAADMAGSPTADTRLYTDDIHGRQSIVGLIKALSGVAYVH